MIYNKNKKAIDKFDLLDIVCAIAVAFSIIFVEVRLNFEIVLMVLFATYLISKTRTVGKIVVHFDRFVINAYVFTAFCVCSCLWARKVELASLASFRVFMIVVYFQLLLEMYYGTQEKILNVILLASIIVTLYSIFYYGIGSLIKSVLNSNARIENSFNNVNTLGLMSAIGFCVLIFQYLEKKDNGPLIWALILGFFSLATASRKAIVLIGITLGLYYLFVFRKEKSIRRIIIIVFIIIAAIIMVRTGILDNVINRIVHMFGNRMYGEDRDGSMILRKLYMNIGIKHFWEHPLLGIGIDNGRLYIISDYGIDTYLHNNYIELLCDLGIVGTIIYYFLHITILFRFIKYRKFMSNYSKFCLFLELAMIPMDFGIVSYYDRFSWLVFVPIVLESLNLKQQYYIEKKNGLFITTLNIDPYDRLEAKI